MRKHKFDIDNRLHPKQGAALNSAANEILYGGAAGGGKSHLMRIAAILWCLMVPGLQVYLFRRTFPDLNKNHLTGPSSLLAMLGGWMLMRLVRYNASEHTFKFNNGSCIHLCHCQNENDVYQYQGAEIHVLLIDEITHWTRAMYAYLRGRVRLGGLIVPESCTVSFPRILISGNPGGIGHNWVKQDFVDVQPAMHVKQMEDDEGGMLRQYIPAKLSDNPTMEKNDPKYRQRLMGLHNPALVKAMLDGDWNIVAGGMFDDLWYEDILFIPPFAIPPSWRITRAFDWGSSRPFSVGWYAISDGTTAILANNTRRTYPAKTMFRIAEWYGWNGKANEGMKMSDSEIARGIIQREKELGIHMRVKPGPADSSIFDEINGDSPAKMQERAGVRWVEADKRPGTRVRRWQLIRGRMLASRMRTGEPELYFFNTCTHAKRLIPVAPRDEKKVDDIDTDWEDHLCDELGYMVLDGTKVPMGMTLGAATNG